MAPPRPAAARRAPPGQEFPYDTVRTPPGPVLPLRVGKPDADPPVALAAVVDSGADITVLPAELPAALGAPAIGEVAVQGVGGVVQRAPVYAVLLEAAGRRRVVEVVAVGGEGLLGRDVLNAWRVVLDGPQLRLRVEPPSAVP